MKFFTLKHSLCGEIGALHKGVFATLGIDKKEKWVSIYMIESTKPDEGNAQDFVRELKRLTPKDYALWSSVPLNDKWEHICKKYGLKYTLDNEPKASYT